MAAVLVLALPIFLAESVIGRRSGCDTFGAMNKLAPGSKWKWLGLLTVITPIILLSYYSVVGGWSVEYFFKACCFSFDGNTQGLFARFISSTWAPSSPIPFSLPPRPSSSCWASKKASSSLPR